MGIGLLLFGLLGGRCVIKPIRIIQTPNSILMVVSIELIRRPKYPFMLFFLCSMVISGSISTNLVGSSCNLLGAYTLFAGNDGTCKGVLEKVIHNKNLQELIQ